MSPNGFVNNNIPGQQGDDAGVIGQAWLDRCEALVSIGESIGLRVGEDGRPERGEAIYQRIVNALARWVTPVPTAVYLHVIDSLGGTFFRVASVSDSAQDGFPTFYDVDTGRMRRIIRDRSPVILDERYPNDEDMIPPGMFERYASTVSIPVCTSSGVVGAFSLQYRNAVDWSEEDIAFLMLVGRQVGVVLGSLVTARRLIELSILGDRKQLGTEIHDNLAQMVAASALNADAALMAHEEGDEEALAAALERVGETSRAARKMLRSEIFTLRSPIVNSGDLAADIRKYLDAFEESWGIGASLSIDHGPVPPEVRPTVSLQLVRILNECLSNTLRHAAASRVEVSLCCDGECLSMVVKDDGCGFAVSDVPDNCMGLRIMNERAAIIDARLSVDSGDGGTAVRIDVPRASWLM